MSRHGLILSYTPNGVTGEDVALVAEETELQTLWDFGLVWERPGMDPRERIQEPTGERFDGLIVDINDDAAMKGIQDSGVPLVSVSLRPTPPGILRVAPDLRAIGAIAADHFLDLHLRHLALAVSHANSDLVKGFEDAVARRGGEPPHVYVFSSPDGVDKRVFDGPTPVGVLCESDRYARTLADVATRKGVRIPDDLAILGVGNNRMLCGSSPRISSIELPLERMGVEAARALDRLICGKTVRSHHLPEFPRSGIGLTLWFA